MTGAPVESFHAGECTACRQGPPVDGGSPRPSAGWRNDRVTGPRAAGRTARPGRRLDLGFPSSAALPRLWWTTPRGALVSARLAGPVADLPMEAPTVWSAPSLVLVGFAALIGVVIVLGRSST